LRNSDYCFGEKSCDNRDNHIQKEAIIVFCEKSKTQFRVNPTCLTSDNDNGDVCFISGLLLDGINDTGKACLIGVIDTNKTCFFSTVQNNKASLIGIADTGEVFLTSYH
jgi:hypothetical protein